METGGLGSTPPAPPSPPLHPAIAPLSYLLGRWRGEGEGGFPTINSFQYGEELLFSHSGKPVIAYTQKTWKLSSGEPMHAESGYWRPKPDGSIEVLIAQSTGLVEVQKGSYDAENKTVTLRSELVGNASKVKEISRSFKVTNGELSYVVQMATTMTSLQPHLKALLRKI
ncbi:peroxynitrite isomerase Rv2717c [Typha angustifolia]|uniref:peroxynitrite isomerase Rv2717c n=1 Tax=Typha angustifolia TaxID=59011 RepID=UPI003C3039F2